MNEDDRWFDEEAGPLVRPYAVTGGRTRAVHPELDLITLVITLHLDVRSWPGEPEYDAILRMCGSPTSVAEISAALQLPLGVVKVLVGDLIERHQVMVRSSAAPDTTMLQAVLEGIRRI
jgi:hypothetical protein